jgi:cytochrome c biogenesis protein CcmG, thiol:disulfide interchange protein DsbE
MWIALTVGAVVTALVVVLATSTAATKNRDQQMANSPLLSHLAPEISGPLYNGGTAKLSDNRGKWVLINFFASWCIPCQQEQADLVRFQQHHQVAGDATVFAVRFDDPEVSAIRTLMTKSGATWPVVDDPEAKIHWGVTGPPESFLVDPNGFVRAHVIGQINADTLEGLLGQTRAVVGQ